ncbi:MAG TPA: hypothetical protein VNU22_05380 [Candidatus Acidoferrum sp.]|nr:hypothetical protein [Candidatus Acidoferrum sp.]
MLLRIGACWFALLSVACGSRLPPAMPSNAIVGAASALPTPRVEPNDAPPKMLGMRFSSLDVRRGEHWSGWFVTGTDVASVEVRTSLFSINVPHVGPGRFQFTLDVLDTPPIFVRSYRLRVIARNSAGDEDEEDLPFRIR